MVDYTDLTSVLVWLALGGGGAAIASAAFTYIAENWSAWHGLPHAVKFVLPMAVSVAIAIGAEAALQYVPGVVEQIAPWFRIAALSITAWLSGQRAYIGLKTAHKDGAYYGAEYRKKG